MPRLCRGRRYGYAPSSVHLLLRQPCARAASTGGSLVEVWSVAAMVSTFRNTFYLRGNYEIVIWTNIILLVVSAALVWTIADNRPGARVAELAGQRAPA